MAARRTPPDKAKKASAPKRKRPAVPRHERAQETRMRMCTAAEDLFRANGYSATTMEAVAKRAGVAVQTVYFSFHTKGLLFLDVIARMAHGPKVVLPAGTPAPAFTVGLMDEQDPQRLLALLVDGGHDFTLRFAPMWPYVQIAAEDDPEFKARFNMIIDARRRGMQGIFAMLEGRGALRTSAARAAETYFLLANPELMLLSSTSLNWSLERYKAWTWELAVAQTLRDATPRADAVRGLGFASAVTSLTSSA